MLPSSINNVCSLWPISFCSYHCLSSLKQLKIKRNLPRFCCIVELVGYRIWMWQLQLLTAVKINRHLICISQVIQGSHHYKAPTNHKKIQDKSFFFYCVESSHGEWHFTEDGHIHCSTQTLTLNRELSVTKLSLNQQGYIIIRLCRESGEPSCVDVRLLVSVLSVCRPSLTRHDN